MSVKLYGLDRSFLHDTTEADPFVIDMVRAQDYLKAEAEIARLNEQVRELKGRLQLVAELNEVQTALHAEAEKQVMALAALAEERREFIVNGVEFGYIRIPSVPLDKATGTYERCLLKPKFAADAILREVAARAVEGLKEHPAIGLLALGSELDKHAAAIRSGDVQP